MEKSAPRDYRLSSLGKPCDAKRRSSGQVFLSFPHPHDNLIVSRDKKIGRRMWKLEMIFQAVYTLRAITLDIQWNSFNTFIQ